MLIRPWLRGVPVVFLLTSLAQVLSAKHSALEQSRALRHAADLLDSLRYDLAHSAKPVSSASLEGLQLLQRSTDDSAALDEPPHRHEQRKHQGHNRGARGGHGMFSTIFTTQQKLSPHDPATVQTLAANLREAVLDATLEDGSVPQSLADLTARGGSALHANVDLTTKKLRSASNIADLPKNFWNTFSKSLIESFNAEKAKANSVQQEQPKDLNSFLKGAFQRSNPFLKGGSMPDPLDLPAWIAFGQQFKIMDAFQQNMAASKNAATKQLLSKKGGEDSVLGDSSEDPNELPQPDTWSDEMPAHFPVVHSTEEPEDTMQLVHKTTAHKAAMRPQVNVESDDIPELPRTKSPEEPPVETLVRLKENRTSVKSSKKQMTKGSRMGPKNGFHSIGIVIVVLLVVLCVCIYLAFRKYNTKQRDNNKVKVPYPPAKIAARMIPEDNIDDEVVQFAPSRRVAMAGNKRFSSTLGSA